VPESTQGKVVLDPSRIRASVLIGTLPAGALVAVTFRTTATADRTVVDHRRTVEVLTSRLETE